MSKSKTFESNSKLFQISYSLILVFISIAILLFTDDKIHVVFLWGVNLLPLAFVAFIFKTFYKIKDGKLMKFTTGGKNSSPSMIVNLQDVKSTRPIYKREKLIGVKLYDQTEFELMCIYLEEPQEFLNLLNKEIGQAK